MSPSPKTAILAAFAKQRGWLEECDAEWTDAILSALREDFAIIARTPTVAVQEAVSRIPLNVGLAWPVHIPTTYARELVAAIIAASEGER